MFAISLSVVIAISGSAYALSVSPEGGAPGSDYTVQVDCASSPSLYVTDLRAGIPPATIAPLAGIESSPGTWDFEVHAGDVDQMVKSSCGGEGDSFRYDVDSAQLFPGPTFATYSDVRPGLIGSTVVGTDCPAGTKAVAVFTDNHGFSATRSITIDAYGNWEIKVPDSAPTGQLVVHATCGDVSYDPLVLEHTAEISDTTSTSNPSGPPTSADQQNMNSPYSGGGDRARPAVPVTVAPHYTG